MGTSPRIITLALAIAAGTAGGLADAPNLAQRRAVEEAMLRANSYYQNNFPLGTAVWNRGAYHVGNVRAWQYLGVPRDYDYSVAWSAANNWSRGPEGPAHADAHCCGQVYIDLYRADPQPVRISNIKSTMDALVGLPAADDDWWWIDAFYMAAPTFAKLGVVYGNPDYFTRLETMYLHMKNTRQLFDPAHGLWYRDAAAKGRTGDNTPEFWGRGNGWVIAGCARLLEELPAGDPRRAEFATMLQTMAAALLPWQGSDGFWRSNIMFPAHFPNPETSCTAFFTYAIAHGINAGILDAATYTPVVMNAWNGMVSTALHPSGKLGFVQAIGLDPKAATYSGDQDYGYGAFLLAGVEILRLLGGPAPVTPVAGPDQTLFDIDGDFAETVRLDASDTIIRDGAPVQFTWWLGEMFLGAGASCDVSLPLGTHALTLRVAHGSDAPYTALTTVRVQPRAQLPLTVTASGFETGNPPARTIDGSLSTRWSDYGIGRWLQVELPDVILLDRVMLAFYLGDTRLTFFDLAVSTDGSTWEQVFTGQSSGTTDGLETYQFPARNARFVRFIGRGNSINIWNSVSEFSLPLAPVASASGFQQGNPPSNAFDGNLATRWSHDGIGQWLQLNLPHPVRIDRAQLAFHLGDTRVSFFDLAVSTDGSTWEQVFTGQSSGTTTSLETFAFPPRNARHLRYIGRGNSESIWNSVTEFSTPLAEALDTTDSDLNGLPDSWEIHYFGSTGQDPQLDSFYIAGLDPRSAAPDHTLQIEPAANPGIPQLRLLPRGALGPGYTGKTRRYRLLTNPDPTNGSWQPLAGQEIIIGDNLPRIIPLETSAPSTFYRASSWLD